VSGVDEAYNLLGDMFECIENFLRRLAIYTEIKPTPAMAEMAVKIMAELLSGLALATKEIRQGRASESSLTDENSWLNTWQRNISRN
jgi:hypothetical protein